MRSPRLGPTWISVSALTGACAALFVPGATSSTAAGAAALLAVGAIALLAGHTWGLLVSIPSHVTLVGRVWPALAASGAGSAGLATDAAVAVVLVTALPALALTAAVLPQIARHIVGDASPRVRALVVAGCAIGLALALILPAL